MSIINNYINNLVPTNLDTSKSNKHNLDLMLQNNLGNNMLQFVQELKFVKQKRMQGKMYCPPSIKWPTANSVNLNCGYYPYVLNNHFWNSDFMRLLNIYTRYVTDYRLAAYRKSRGLR